MSEKPHVLLVAGTTASGKTDLAIALAKEFNGEVISADSRQVYRKLDIGTAKVTTEEMQGVPHHCIDVADIDEVYNAEHFVAAARAAITDITARGKLPIIAGGTYFYIDLALGRSSSPSVDPNPTLRKALETLPVETLFAKLQAQDPARAATMDPQNKRRLIRALEIVSSLGSVPPTQTEEHYNTLWLGIERERDTIRNRITNRATQWLVDGFKAEVEWLLTQNLPPERLREFGFEYTVGAAWVCGEINDAEFVEQIVAKNWQYAKRQLTWLRGNKDIVWLDAEKPLVKQAKPLLQDWLPY